jgi:MFS family permease
MPLLVDWLGFRRASVLTDLASAATVAAIPLLYLVGVLAFWQLLVLVFVLSSLNSNGDSARFALVPALARRATMPIERANSADRAIVRLGAVLGPPLAGVLIALIGASNVLFVDAVTFSVSAALVTLGVSSAASADRRPKPSAKGLTRLLEVATELANFSDIPLVTLILPASTSPSSSRA